jgi:hypothetical protein
MRLACTIASSLLVTTSVAAQEPQITWRSTAKTALFIEVLGNGGLLSYNLDRKLNESATLRLGYGRYSSICVLCDQETKRYRTFTAMLNTLVAGPPWSLELGVGGVVGSYRGDYWVIPSKPISEVTSVVGLRRQPVQGGRVFRVGLAPRYVIHGENPRDFSVRPGMSAGLAF